MSKQTLVFKDIEVNKKDFHISKKVIPLNLVDVNNIIISKRAKNNNDTSKYLSGYNYEDKIRPLHIFYHKLVDISNILKMVVKTCHLKLKMKIFI